MQYFTREVVNPRVSLPLPAADPTVDHPHQCQLALMEGDILVLMTDEHDEYNLTRDQLFVVDVFYVHKINLSPEFNWELRSASRIIRGSEGQTPVTPLLSMGAEPPFTLVKRPRGICTKFLMKIAHGYRIHPLPHIERNYPELIDSLHIAGSV